MHKKMILLPQWLRTEEIPSGIRRKYMDECALGNKIPALVILTMILAMESTMVIIYCLNLFFVKKGHFFPQYIYLYVSMMIFSLCFIILIKIFENVPENLMAVEMAMLLTVGVWSAIFSAYDVINGFSSYLFIQLIIINSLLFKVNPVKHCLINAVSFLVYMALILWARLTITITFAELVNPFFMLVMAEVMIIFRSRTKYQDYINQKLIDEQHKKLEFYANNDFLTKISNRKSIIEYMDDIMEKCDHSINCMMIDIDRFKLYNDAYGHIMGDKCLIKLSAAFDRFAGKHGGRVGRYGGEEFLVLFADMDEEAVTAAANELIEMIRELNIEFSAADSCRRVTISVGVHIQDKIENPDKDAILTAADNALYKAKNQGRNRMAASWQKDSGNAAGRGGETE